jgi:hypothetical protein
MAANTLPSEARAARSWTAVLAGIVASLVIQVMLTMFALGIGLVSIDVPTAATAPTAISTAALLWWICSGVFAAFIGGAVAGVLTPFAAPLSRTAHALAAWAIAVLIVVGFSSLSAGTATAVASSVAGPGVVATARLQTLTVPRQGAAPVTQAQLEQARKAAATATWSALSGFSQGHLPQR